MKNAAIIFSSFVMAFITSLGNKKDLSVPEPANKLKLILGISVSAIVLNISAVYFGGFLAGFLPEFIMKLEAGITFIVFSLYLLYGRDKNKTAFEISSDSVIITAVSFFISEFGSMAHISEISLTLAYKYMKIPIFSGCCAGMLAGKFLNIFAGNKLIGIMPMKFIKNASSLFFAGIAAVNFYAFFSYLFGNMKAIIFTAIISSFIVIAVIRKIVAKANIEKRVRM